MKTCRICGIKFDDVLAARISIMIINKSFDYCSFKCFKKGKHGKFVNDIVKESIDQKYIK